MSVQNIKAIRVIGSHADTLPFLTMFNRVKGHPFRVLPFNAKVEPDLVLFVGGPDIDPSLYGEERLGRTSVVPRRDQQDRDAWHAYRDIPKVGICRGGQFLNVMCGGAMWQHVDNHTSSHRLTNLLPLDEYEQGDLFPVTSTHHQMMIPGKFGEVLAIGEQRNGKNIASEYISANENRVPPEFDTEVVWYEKEKALCFQPHPEYGSRDGTEKYFFSLMNYFFKD